ncbi:hypothetical protein [Haloarcula amylovorans]|uniref:hypothetical protein n=1 Tax=Haloarcula amylovorans TaxID=2562280 RepID=UPI001075E2B5|nr:hypothetical protein [Halomicroarcula amylolytica]
MTENSIPRDTPRNEPPSADEDVAKLRLQLKHLSLEELEAKELVRWNRDEHVVRKGSKFGEKNTN